MAALRAQADVVIGQTSAEAAGLEIVSKLAAQGFCTVSPGFEDDTLARALEEVAEFQAAGRWQHVNSIIQDGLLGAEGSAQIAELESPELDETLRSDGEVLMKLDSTMTHLGFHMEPYLGIMGFDVSHRSRAVVHQAGEPDEEPVALTEKEVMRWLAQFLRHKVMVIVFLGPASGTLELQPHIAEDAETLEIRTVPGMIVVLRPDILSHKHFSPGRAVAMSSFFLQGNLHRQSGRAVGRGGSQMTPAAKELDDWTVGRLRELKEKSFHHQSWDPDIPRDWQSAMNHMFHKGQMIAVRGTACKFPGTEDPRVFSQASTVGPDYPTEVPRLRWDHEEVFDPDPESWRIYKSYCKHGSFMDGIELFDCKMFSMSPNEAKSMDPHQRLILEVGYEGLHNMGMRKNTMVNTSCGVYVGCGNMEWGMMPREQDMGAFAATGGALSISSGRFSFTLGLKGPSMTLDTDASSGATALYLAAESVQRKGRAVPNDYAVAISAHLLLAAVWWPSHCASGWLCPEGRCMTFDASAAGYVRGDGVAAVAVKPMTTLVDGNYVTSEDPPLGSIAGAMMNNNGKGASLASPHGPAEQEAIAEAIRNASISPADVDAVECHGAGGFLADAIEVGSMARAHRSEEQRDPPLLLSAVKSSMGNQIETSGLAGFLKTIYSSQYGVMTPNLHLRQANPHTDLSDQPVSILSECTEYKMPSSFVGVMSRGFGGSNIYLITWGDVKFNKESTGHVISQRDQIMFWPGGGGALESDAQPARAYTVVGTWSQWHDPAPMEAEGNGTYSFTVTLGENRWEQFQIWLDGDPNRVLHPGQAKGYKNSNVFGPDSLGHGCNWLIDGCTELPAAPASPQIRELEDLLPSWQANGDSAASSKPSADFGLPGDRYRVQLRVIGRWRTVTWERLPSEQRAELATRRDQAGLLAQGQRQGHYYIAGSWNDWSLQEMLPDPNSPGVFHATASLWRSGGEFQILRNRDWRQVLHPSSPRTSRDALGVVEGPDDLGHGLNWFLNGRAGDAFRIELRRSLEDTQGTDTKSVSWECLQPDAVSQTGLERASRRSYCIVGSWTSWQEPQEMQWEEGCYRYTLQIGGLGEESFQILLDGLRERALHPDKPDANPHMSHVLQGPSMNAHGLNWTVGRHQSDGCRPGSCYEVKLMLTSSGEPKHVQWSKIDPSN
ncbi:unnamed protein product [Polarella glacialis]|uniref:Ketosynthase family 3 (KS3) domain-containing protein n=1 Tax=Polarella glacialis TaxID=89957 RepID=A0A813HVF8_POLGL|nr:unnamed protein product [Polarella glacialis]